MKNYLVIGLGKFGTSIARTLHANGNVVVAMDEDEELVQRAIDEDIVEDAITLDVTDETALKKIVKDGFDAAFVCIGTNVQASILVTLMLKEMGFDTIVCKAESKKHGKVLEKLGASTIVYPEELVGEKIAYSIMNPSVIDYFEFSDDYVIFDIKVPNAFVGKSIIELGLRNRYKVNIIAIRDINGALDVIPTPGHIFNKDESIIFLGKNQDIQELINGQ